jgi:hypothetical protein
MKMIMTMWIYLLHYTISNAMESAIPHIYVTVENC